MWFSGMKWLIGCFRYFLIHAHALLSFLIRQQNNQLLVLAIMGMILRWMFRLINKHLAIVVLVFFPFDALGEAAVFHFKWNRQLHRRQTILKVLS
jgi:hypothetical protein